MARLRDARPRRVAVSVRLDPRVLDWLKSNGEAYLTRIYDMLTNLMEAEQTDAARQVDGPVSSGRSRMPFVGTPENMGV